MASIEAYESGNCMKAWEVRTDPKFLKGFGAQACGIEACRYKSTPDGEHIGRCAVGVVCRPEDLTPVTQVIPQVPEVAIAVPAANA